MWHIIINGEKLINFEDIYYYGEKLINYCGDKLIYCLTLMVDPIMSAPNKYLACRQKCLHTTFYNLNIVFFTVLFLILNILLFNIIWYGKYGFGLPLFNDHYCKEEEV